MASAIAVTETETEHGGPQNGLKRRQSSVSEQESKRPRISPGKNSPPAQPIEASKENLDSEIAVGTERTADQGGNGREARRRSSVADEKQRSKRLFGALLGNLNQGNASDRASKRRKEIEDRRKAELQRQDDERLEDKQRRIERLAEHRKNEQHVVDEQNVQVRHKSMLHTANFLQTKAEPQLYFRPWELRSDEEDQIEDQIREIKEQIERENASLEASRGTQQQESNAVVAGNGDDSTTEGVENTQPLQHPPDTDHNEPADHVGLPTQIMKNDGAGTDNTEHLDTPHSTNGKTQDGGEEIDNDGDHVVEGDEDTVIY